MPIPLFQQSRPLAASRTWLAFGALVCASACSSAATSTSGNSAGAFNSAGGQAQGGAATGGSGGAITATSGAGGASAAGAGGLVAAGTGGTATAGTGGTPAAGGTAGAAGSSGVAGATASGPRYFKGICYEGYRDGQNPGGPEPTCEQVKQDLTLIASFTRGIRTYGSSSANHDGKCIPGIADTLGLELNMGVWVDETYGDMTNYAAIDDALVTVCGPTGAGSVGCPNGASVHTSIKTVLVGNEYLLRVDEAKGDLVLAEKHLVSYVQYARARLPKNIEVDTSESYPLWLTASAALFQAVDNVVWQAHPFWEGQSIATAAAGFAATHDKVLAKMKQYGITKPERCGETGWPWGGTQGQAVGSPANQAQYFKDLNAYATKSGLQIWAFEAFDENWKGTAAHTGASEGTVGAEWGLLASRSNRRSPRRRRDHRDAVFAEPVAAHAASFEPRSNPSLSRLSAVATIASSLERGTQPSRRVAFSLVAFRFRPSSGTMPRAAGLFRAERRTNQFGSTRVGTLPAAAPMRRRSTFATSTIHRLSPEMAMKRSPLAAGFVIARRCRSATSRTSTNPELIFGHPGGPSIRFLINRIECE